MSEAVVDLVPVAQSQQAVSTQVFMPAMSIDVALARRQAIVQFTSKIMVADQDFGVIPGTNKPTLLKPGAEKLCCFFGLEPEFLPITEEMDWTGEKHNGETFYYIRYKCRLLRDGRVLGVGEGSGNSWESKYRWRDGKRKCPKCGQEAIIVGKQEYGGGWLCFGKKGGCGAKFGEKDEAIIGQKVGRVPNPDIADVINTIQKMAQKRALIAATLLATSASEFFTQDMEDSAPIDTGGQPYGTREAQRAVADRKIEELKAKATPAREPETPAEVLAIWSRMAGKKENITHELQVLHSDLADLVPFEDAELIYQGFVAKYGDPLKSKKAARWIARDLWERIQKLKSDPREHPENFVEAEQEEVVNA